VSLQAPTAILFWIKQALEIYARKDFSPACYRSMQQYRATVISIGDPLSRTPAATAGFVAH
jgi:hypothetical protein